MRFIFLCFLFLTSLFVFAQNSEDHITQVDSAKFYHQKAQENSVLGFYDKELNYNLLYYNYSASQNDTFNIINATINIGISKMYLQEYKSSLDYYVKAETLLDHYESDSLLARVLVNKANNYKIRNELDSSLTVLKQAIDVFTTIGNNRGIVSCGIIEADCYFLKEEYSKTEDLLLNLIETNKPDSSAQGFILYRISEVCMEQKKHQSAIEYANKGLEIIDREKIKQILYGILAASYYALEDYKKAYDYEHEYSELKDKLSREAQKNRSLLLEAEFRFENQQNEIKILQQQNEITAFKNQQAERKNQVFLMLLAFVVALIIILLVLFRKRKIYGEKMKEAKELAEYHEQVKEEFLSNTSHEIRAPLHAIIGNSELLLKSSNFENNELLDVVNSSGKHLLNVVNDILDKSKIESGRLEFENIPVKINEELQSVVDLFKTAAADKKLRLEFSVSRNIPELLILDPTRLRQMLINLISNAIKFTSTGAVALSADSDRGLLILRVKDDGVGIDPAKIDGIFDSFVQENKKINRVYGGTGLGLSITKKLVEKMGGNISVQSKLNIGTTFTLEIPLIEYHNELADKTPVLIDLEEKTVLIVEDNVISSGTIKRQVEFLNANATIVNTGESALSLLEQKKFDLLLLDHNLPGISGIEVASKIKQPKEVSSPKIIFISGESEEFISKKLKGINIEGVLAKPFSLEALNNILEATFPSLSTVKSVTDGDFQKTHNAELHDLYLSEVPLMIQEIKKHLSENDLEKVNFLIHKIKPCYFYIGEKTMYNFIDEMEDNIKGLSDVELIEKVKYVCDETAIILKKMRNNED